MTYLLDTNVVSEWVKARPSPGVVAWLAEADEDRIFLSVCALAELRYGIARMAAGARRQRLDAWLSQELPLRFEGRILPIDASVADRWGVVRARGKSAGRSIDIIDGFIAATAEVHHLTVVTRDTKVFRGIGASVFDPWSEGR